MNLAASELILKEDGSIYHLGLHPNQVPDHIIVVGDPERVPKVSQYFDQVDEKIIHREFVSHIGRVNGKDVMVISSGMGTDNVEILVTELDALVNIDLDKRERKEKHQPLNIIRVGTSGALQEDIPLDAYLVSDTAIGLDTLMCFYKLKQSAQQDQTCKRLQELLNLPFQPYMVEGSSKLKDQLAHGMLRGNTLTCPGFYGPQGRDINGTVKHNNLIEQLSTFHIDAFWITNFEMETAGYYALCYLLGHEMISLNAILANRIQGSFSSNAEQTVDGLIREVIDRL